MNEAQRSELDAPDGSATTDTARLDFLMQFFEVADCGDVEVSPGVVVDQEAVSDAFDRGALSGEVVTLMGGWQNPDMRRVIDKAMRGLPKTIKPNHKAVARPERQRGTLPPARC